MPKTALIQKKFPFWLYILPVIAALGAFFPIFNIYFSGEDFVFIYAAGEGKPFYSATQTLFYRPLPNLFWQMDYALWGLNPLGYHFTNLVLHLINTILVMGLAYDLFPNQRGYAALISGLLFALQAAHLEPVVWVAGRPDLLATLCFLVSVISGLKFFLPEIQAKKSGWLIISLGAFGAGLFSKESALSLPLVLFGWLLLNYPHRDWLKLVFFSVLYVAVIGAYVLVRVQALGSFGGYPSEGNQLLYILWNSTLGFWLPLLFPINLAVTGWIFGIILALLFAGVYVAIGVRFILGIPLSPQPVTSFPTRGEGVEFGGKGERGRVWWFGLLVFYGGLLPVINIAPVSASLEQSRILYLPSIGFCLLLSWFCLNRRSNVSSNISSQPSFYQKLKIRFKLVPVSLLLIFSLVTVYVNSTAWQVAGEGVRQTFVEWNKFRAENQITIRANDTTYYEGLPDAYKGAYLWRNGLDEASKVLTRRDITGVHRLENVLVDYRRTQGGRLWFVRFPKNNYQIGAVYGVGAPDAFVGETGQSWKLNECRIGAGFPNGFQVNAGQGQILCEVNQGIQFQPGAKSSLELSLPPQTVTAKTLYLDLGLYMNFDFENPQALCEVLVKDQGGQTLVDYNFDIAANGKSQQYRLILPLENSPQNLLQITLRVNKVRSNVTFQTMRLITVQ
jgi:protein O-mannosyl-transferase